MTGQKFRVTLNPLAEGQKAGVQGLAEISLSRLTISYFLSKIYSSFLNAALKSAQKRESMPRTF